MKKLSKLDTQKHIIEFFSNIKHKKNKEVKKIKRIAMKNNIPLKNLRKRFCKKCLTPYHKPKIRIKNKIKSIKCESCSYVSRWKINSF